MTMFDSLIHALRGLGRFLLISLIWPLVLFNLGRGTLLLCTLGRCPRGPALTRDASRVSLAGFGALLGAWTAIAIYNNFVSPTWALH